VDAVHVRSDRWYDLPADRRAVWAAFTATDRYRSWWPWLVGFDGAGLTTGARWTCAVSPPLPYVVRFHLDLVAVEPAAAVTAEVSGDIEGTARLELHDPTTGAGPTRLHLVADLAPSHPALRLVAATAAPVVRRGHDWVLDTGAAQFVERGLRTPGPTPPGR